ncbi:MAG: hypothetical protein AB7Q29_07270 [Vicinamibacterales bacterium]
MQASAPRPQPSATAGTAVSGARAAVANVLVLSGIATAGIASYILIGLDGWSYYTAPAAIRGYTAAHPLLRPTGRVGHLFGVIGFVMMLMPVAYAVRKKMKRLRNLGSMRRWLDLHIFCGIVGPVFVTFHTSFKFGGIISVAYWSMMIVVSSGFIGRYLFNRIPRTLRGLEVDEADLNRRAADLGRELADGSVPELLLRAIEEFEQRVVPSGDVSYFSVFTVEHVLRREVARFEAAVTHLPGASSVHERVIAIGTERATLLRRMAHLRRTKQLFELWHVFHMPLVYIMFAIVVAHVGVTLYMGYVPFSE